MHVGLQLDIRGLGKVRWPADLQAQCRADLRSAELLFGQAEPRASQETIYMAMRRSYRSSMVHLTTLRRDVVVAAALGPIL
jgi:hypothetical protein